MNSTCIILHRGRPRSFVSARNLVLLGYPSLSKQQITTGVRAIVRAADELALRRDFIDGGEILAVPARVPRVPNHAAKILVQR